MFGIQLIAAMSHTQNPLQPPLGVDCAPRHHVSRFVGFILVHWVFLLSLRAQLFDEPIKMSAEGAASDPSQVLLDVRVSHFEGIDFLDRTVIEILQLRPSEGGFRRASASRIAFAPGAVISDSSLSYTNEASGDTWAMALLWYVWTEHRPGPWVTARSVKDFFPGQTNILIGFARPHPQGTGTQYGWVRLERDTPNPSDIFWPDGREKRVAFWPAGSAIHPIPDRPIRAGEAPDLPQLTSEFLPATESLPPRIRVQWPTGWDTLRLEQATDLAPPVLWTRVPEVVGSSAEFVLHEDGQLFLRLVHVP